VKKNNKKSTKIDLVKKSAKIGAIVGLIYGVLSVQPFVLPDLNFTISHLFGRGLGGFLHEISFDLIYFLWYVKFHST
jgi:hypothetical protein